MKSLMEKAVLSSIAMLMLYAATAAVWFLFRADACKKARAKYQDASESYEYERKLISEKRKWFERYDEESAKMPAYDPSVSKWAKIVDVAKDHDISIARANVKGEPEDDGDVVVLVVDTNGWSGGWESLVNFIYAIENDSKENGLFDISSLTIDANKKFKGVLSGKVTFSCAYMRGNQSSKIKERR